MTVLSFQSIQSKAGNARLAPSSSRQVRSKGTQQFAPGATIHTAGEPALHALEILAGEVLLTAPTRGGKRMIVMIAGPRAVVGHAVEGRQLCTAVALAPVTVRPVGFGTKRHVAGLAEQLKACLRHQGALSSPGAIGRLASFFVERAELRQAPRSRGKESGSVEISVPISRGGLAAHLGMKAETLSRGLAELRIRNLIEKRGVGLIRIVDLNRLRSLCE